MCDDRNIAGIRYSHGGRSYVPTRKYLICAPQNNFHGVQTDEWVYNISYNNMRVCIYSNNNNNDNMPMMMTQFFRHRKARPKWIRGTTI